MSLTEAVKPRRSPKVVSIATGDDVDIKQIIFHTPVSRFGFADFSVYGKWLADKIHAHWPQVNQRTLYGWLKGCSESSEFHFVKTKHAVSLAQIIHEHLNPIPEIEEIFTYVDDLKNNQALCEGASLYLELKRWATTLSASAIVVSDRTDVPHNLIETVLGPLAERDSKVAKVT